MKASWINNLFLSCLLASPVWAVQDPVTTAPEENLVKLGQPQEEGQAEETPTREDMKEALEMGKALERAMRLLRAYQPKQVFDHLATTDFPEPLENLLMGWAYHQQGDYDAASTFFQKVDQEELKGDRYFANRLEELRKTADELKSFAVFETENFSFRYRVGADKVMLYLLPEIMERVYVKFSKLFHYTRDEKIIVELMPNYRLFSYASALSKTQIETTGTIALCVENRLVVLTPRRVLQGYYWPDVIAHEFVHYILTKQSSDHVPLWMQEGVAKYFEGRWDQDDINPLGEALESSLAFAIKEDILLTVDQMMPSFAALPTAAMARQAYAQTTAMIDYLCKRNGEDIVYQIVSGLKDQPNLDTVMMTQMGEDFAAFEKGWRQWLKEQPYRIHRPGLMEEEQALSLLDEDAAVEQIQSLEEGNQEQKKHLRLGDLLLERSRYRAALKQYQKTIADQEILDRQVVLRLLECYRNLGQQQDIVNVIDRYVLDLERDTTMLIRKAQAQIASDKQAEAEVLLERAIRINPFNPEIYKLLLGMELDGEEKEKYRNIINILNNPSAVKAEDRES